MNSELHFFGHACLRLRTRGGGVITDPWFSRDGAFFRAWFQFPENAPLEEEAFDRVTDIVVSHNHADHFDPPVLARALAADANRRLHIAKFATPWFTDRVRRSLPEFVDRIVEHTGWEWFEAIGGLRVRFVPEESPGQIDAAIVITDGERTWVNLNDARLSPDQLGRIRREAGSVDMLALQASGASEYPVNYTYDADDMQRRLIEKRRLKFEHAERIIDDLDPRRVLFFAGPPCFLDPALRHFNERRDDSVFPDQLDIVGHYSGPRPDIVRRTWFALPGERLDDEILWDRTDLASSRMTPYREKENYVADYARRREDMLAIDDVAPPAEDDLRRHFGSLVTLSSWASRRIGGEVEFHVHGAGQESIWTVDFSQEKVRPGAAEFPLYVLHAPAFSVADVVAGHATWDDIFLSLRMTFDERTKRFVSHLKTLLKYADAKMLDELETYEAKLRRAADRFEVEHDGRRYSVQRHCPHAGADLSKHGRVEDGAVVCMAHRFVFDLQTGQCRNADGYRLKVRRIEQKQTNSE